jgi:hypothetical protein
MIAVDFSWASIHGVLISCNSETIFEYAQRVYRRAKCEIDVNKIDKSWLSICAFHKMRRIIPMIDMLKPKNLDQQRMAIFAFTLLLNSKTLKIITEYFELMCKLFISKYSTMRVKIAFESIIKILQERPEDLLEIKKIMNKTEKSLKLQSELTDNSEVFTALQLSDSADNDEIPEIVENQEVENEKENNEQKRTIKESSPFTQIFYDIYNRCLTDIINENESSRQPTNKY